MENVNSNWLDNSINDAVEKGLISFSSTWIERAVVTKNPRLSVALADSTLIKKFDRIDIAVLRIEHLN